MAETKRRARGGPRPGLDAARAAPEREAALLKVCLVPGRATASLPAEQPLPVRRKMNVFTPSPRQARLRRGPQAARGGEQADRVSG